MHELIGQNGREMKEITSRNKEGSNSTKKWGICERDLSGGESREEGVELLV